MSEPVEGEGKRGPGRPRGLPKTGGRRKGTTNRLPSELRQIIIDKAHTIEYWLRLANNQKIKVASEDRKSLVTVYPTEAAQREAQRVLLDRIVPVLKGVELSGPDGLPVQHEDITELEVARRLAYLMQRGLGAAESGECRSSRTTGSGVSGEAGGCPPNAAPCPTALFPEPATVEPATAPLEPTQPKVGEVVRFSDRLGIVNEGPPRDGLPDAFVAVETHGGSVHRRGTWPALRSWAEKMGADWQAPEPWRTGVSLAGRADQFESVSRPDVVRGHGERKMR